MTAGRRLSMPSELEAAWESWNRVPGEEGTAARLEEACRTAAGGATATEIRESLAAGARAKLGSDIAVVVLPAAKTARPDVGPAERPRMGEAVSISVSGPLSWSWFWPKGEVEYLLKRAAIALRRLSVKEAPLGVYTVTVSGSSRQVIRSAREDV